jgi:hypothetical protein
MNELVGIQRVIVPRSCVDAAHGHLRNVGCSGLEGFALWAGQRSGDQFFVRETIIPDQRGIRTDRGLCVTVNGEELHRINVLLYDQKMTLLAQLHSHPEEAFHSDTDNAFPIATATGSLSLVLPNFAQESFSIERCAVYRLTQLTWLQLTQDEVNHLFLFTA